MFGLTQKRLCKPLLQWLKCVASSATGNIKLHKNEVLPRYNYGLNLTVQNISTIVMKSDLLTMELPVELKSTLLEQFSISRRSLCSSSRHATVSELSQVTTSHPVFISLKSWNIRQSNNAPETEKITLCSGQQALFFTSCYTANGANVTQNGGNAAHDKKA